MVRHYNRLLKLAHFKSSAISSEDKFLKMEGDVKVEETTRNLFSNMRMTRISDPLRGSHHIPPWRIVVFFTIKQNLTAFEFVSTI